MIAADSSVWVDFFKGESNAYSEQLEQSLKQGILVIPPLILFEILSAPGITSEASVLIQGLPRLSLHSGYWERAAHARRILLKKGQKARSMDCLIAQSCIDEDVALITRDSDFRHFKKFGLKLV